MDEIKISVISNIEELPTTDNANYFHSRQLFELCHQTPRHRPYMAVAQTADGRVVGHLLGIVRYRTSWFPPYLYAHCRVLGEGVYSPELGNSIPTTREQLFGMLIDSLKQKLQKRILYLEVSHLSTKMFGYREFRRARFFPVHWMSIHNSLHSHTPEERISEKMKKRIDNAYEHGVSTGEVETDEDFTAFSKLLRQHNFLKPKRYVPDDAFFKGIQQRGDGRLFVTRYKNRVIGCSACVYSQQNAYLWYAAFRRKSFAVVHPDVLTIWHAIKDAHQRGYQHIFFLDVGLPFSNNPYREFILRFGGKPVSTYRWFHCPIKWINRLLSYIYRE